MWVTWLFVIFAIAMVVGPVMMMRPTPGTSKLAAIRAYGNKKGLSIRLPSAKAGEARRDVQRGAHYTLALSEKVRKMGAMEPWGLEKQQQSHEIHFQDEWDWTDKHRPRESLLADLRKAIDTAPEGVRGFGFNASGVSILWDEMCRGKTIESAVDDIIAHLNLLLDIILKHPLPAELLENVDLDQIESRGDIP